MGMIDGLIKRAKSILPSARINNSTLLPQENAATNAATSEQGRRPTPEDQIKYLYRLMWVDPDLRQAILDVREMDRTDGRVKRIHSRIARDTIRGGLLFLQTSPSEALAKEWNDFARRLQLNNIGKLKSDALGLIKEGNLPMQWVLDTGYNVVSGVRMPADTLLPNVGADGRFKDVTDAYRQYDIMTGMQLVSFPLWQLTMGRFDPNNYDDLGCQGRPFLDASRTVWRKLQMTDEDLVIRRRMRAPLRMAHSMEGASDDQVQKYRDQVEKDQAHGAVTDYYMNKKGSVTAVDGDSNLDQIADITYLLDTFFSGTPLPKGLLGFTDGMARDILDDLKGDYFDEVDALQDTQAIVYEQGFRLHLLLKGINPDAGEFSVTFAERRTETLSQTIDRGLKLKALGLPESMVWEQIGINPVDVAARRQWEHDTKYDPYPPADVSATPPLVVPPPVVKVTPGNARQGNSATSIGNG